MKMQLLKAAAVALLQALAVCRAQENAAVGERAIKEAVAVSRYPHMTLGKNQSAASH